MNKSRLYVDASVIAGLLLRDIALESVLSVIPADASLAYSLFGFGEVVSAISARTRAEHGSDQDAEERVRHARLVVSDWTRVDWTPADLDRAITLTARASLALKLPDAIHIAIAERLALPLLTADRQQFAAARSLGLSPVLPAIPE